ncbi:hypothetical protein L1887_56015 [Cichorium endivia]|nr:hypothetical protein L1887_56015 [Cichorium endivia]
MAIQVACIIHAPKNLGGLCLISSKRVSVPDLRMRWKRKLPSLAAPDERQCGHDRLSRMEGRERGGQRDILEAVDVACADPGHVEREACRRDEAERAAEVVVLFRLERHSDGSTCGLEAVNDAQGWAGAP